jgi:hypothetical protein
MPRNKTSNKHDSSTASTTTPNRWALNVDFLMKVGEKHVHDLIWDDFISKESWTIILQIDRMPTKDSEPAFLEHVVDSILQTMARDTRLANMVGCLFNKAQLSPAAEAFKASLLMSLSKSVSFLRAKPEPIVCVCVDRFSQLRRSFRKELAKFVTNVNAFAKMWYCAVAAGTSTPTGAAAKVDMRAHRPVLLTTAFTAMPSNQAKLHNITGPQDVPPSLLALVSHILKNEKNRA